MKIDWQISGDLTAYRKHIDTLMDQARAEERNACAEIAYEEYNVAVRNEWTEYRRAANNIATKIAMRNSAP